MLGKAEIRLFSFLRKDQLLTGSCVSTIIANTPTGFKIHLLTFTFAKNVPLGCSLTIMRLYQ